MSNKAGKKYVAIGIVIAAAVGVGAVAVVAISSMEGEDGFVEPGTDIPGENPGGTPALPDTQPDEQEPIPNEQEPVIDGEASLQALPDSGSVGEQVVVEGAGFASNDAIVVFIDNQVVETEPDLVVADSSGEFSATITIPEVEGGEYDMEAFGREDIARTSFIVN